MAFSVHLGSYGAPLWPCPYLSAGTALGIKNLLRLRPGGSMLLQFLGSGAEQFSGERDQTSQPNLAETTSAYCGTSLP
jgi:hypothetical protein